MSASASGARRGHRRSPTAGPTLAAGESLRDSEARYRVLFDQHPVPMWLYDPGTLRFVDVNAAATMHYGYSRKEFLSMTILDIRPEEDVPRLVGSLGTRTDGEWRHRRRDGSVIDVEVVSREVVLEGALLRLVIALDVSSRREAERKLRDALAAERAAALRLRALDEMKNTFLNAVSHELRTPLSAVIGSAKTLERIQGELDERERMDLLRAITRNAVKLQRMLSDLLDLDRMARGVLRARRTPEELGALVRRVASDVEVVQDRPVEIEVHPMVLPVDPPKVERIVENLLSNAVRYSPPGTPIEVCLRRVPDGAVITVSDHGPGVPEELRQQIFEPFRQGPNAQAHAPGVGIGLSLVARFAEMHGGRAWCDPHPGGGASFNVLLRDPTAPRSEESPSGWAN